MLVLPNSNSK